MSKITLFHGTSSVALKKIAKEKGLGSPFLTDNEDIAEYYADCKTDECGGNMVILKITVDKDKLLKDDNSYAEPLTYFRNKFAQNDRDWGEMLENGEIPYPKDEKDWECSLNVVHSVRVDGFVSSDDITIDYYPGLDEGEEPAFT